MVILIWPSVDGLTGKDSDWFSFNNAGSSRNARIILQNSLKTRLDDTNKFTLFLNEESNLMPRLKIYESNGDGLKHIGDYKSERSKNSRSLDIMLDLNEDTTYLFEVSSHSAKPSWGSVGVYVLAIEALI